MQFITALLIAGVSAHFSSDYTTSSSHHLKHMIFYTHPKRTHSSLSPQPRPSNTFPTLVRATSSSPLSSPNAITGRPSRRFPMPMLIAPGPGGNLIHLLQRTLYHGAPVRQPRSPEQWPRGLERGDLTAGGVGKELFPRKTPRACAALPDCR